MDGQRDTELFGHKDDRLFIKQANIAVDRLSEQALHALMAGMSISSALVKRMLESTGGARSSTLVGEDLTLQDVMNSLSGCLDILASEIKSLADGKGRTVSRQSLEILCIGEIYVCFYLLAITAHMYDVQYDFNPELCCQITRDLVIINRLISI